jgi:hypothetical protein
MNIRSGIEGTLTTIHSPSLCYGAPYAALLSYGLLSDFEAYTNILWT